MPSFEFTDTATTLKLSEVTKDGKTVQAGSLSFTVRNTVQRTLIGRLSVRPGGAAAAAPSGWFAFDGAPTANPAERELEFVAGATQTVKLTVTVPAGTQGGQHLFVIRVVSAEHDPDNDYRDSPAVVFTVPAPKLPSPQPASFPWWIVAVIAVVLIIGGLVAYFALSPSAPPVSPLPPAKVGKVQGPVPVGAYNDVLGAPAVLLTQQYLAQGFNVRFAFVQNGTPAGTLLSKWSAPSSSAATGRTVDLQISQGPSPVSPCNINPLWCQPFHDLLDLHMKFRVQDVPPVNPGAPK